MSLHLSKCHIVGNHMSRLILLFKTEFESQADNIDVEQLWTLFKNKMHSLMNKYISSNLLRGNKRQKTRVSREVKTFDTEEGKLFMK